MLSKVVRVDASVHIKVLYVHQLSWLWIAPEARVSRWSKDVCVAFIRSDRTVRYVREQ